VSAGEGSAAPLRLPLEGPGGAELWVRRAADGGVALAIGGEGQVLALSPPAASALAAWLTPTVVGEWMGTVREHLEPQLATAEALFGEERGAARQLGNKLLEEVPAGLLAQALVLLANAIGPRSRERLVDRINATADFSEDLILRRRLAQEGDAFAYVVAAAALFDALDPDAPDLPGHG
jgi:hypothetical protein